MCLGRRLWIGIALAVAAAGLAGGLAWAFVVRQPSLRRASPSVRRILSSPGRYIGRRVIVTGTVSAVYNPQAATLGAPSKPGLLVTAKDSPSLANVKRGAVVRVTGVVERFRLSVWRNRTGSHKDPGLLSTFDGEPVVRAIRIIRLGGAGLSPAPTPAQPSVRPATTNG